MQIKRSVIGKIIGGGIKHHLSASLDIGPEDIEVGSYVMVSGKRRDYYALVLDLSHNLGVDPRYADQPVQNRLPDEFAAMVNRKAFKPRAELMINLCLENGEQGKNGKILPANSLPTIHSPVCLADSEDISHVFGSQGQPGYWVIGYTREQDLAIPVDMAKLVRRSLGIFGATGTGKSLFARVLLTGLISLDCASSLIFDLHNEMAFDDTATDSGALIPGLKSIFPQRIITFGLGRNTTIRGYRPDHFIEINLSDIQPADVMLLADELNLTDTTQTTISALLRSFGRSWLREFLRLSRNDLKGDEQEAQSSSNRSVASWAKSAGVNRAAAEALWSKLSRIRRLPYVVDSLHSTDSIRLILSYLKSGEHVVLSFGENESDLDFLLVTNLLAKRISDSWQHDAEHYRSTQRNEPRRLVICAEEAHKFLDKDLARQTIFGRLARELRKSYVTVWLIDQRPSQISEEIISQIGTRICGWLGNERDIDAVLTGLSRSDALRGILRTLQPIGQMLVSGWAVPTPIVVRSRWFDEQFVDDLKQESLFG